MAHGQHTWSDEFWRGMLLSPLFITHVPTTSGVTCNHSPLEAHTVGRCWAWLAIITLGKNTLWKDVRRGMPSWPLDNRDSRTTSDVACHHCPRIVQWTITAGFRYYHYPGAAHTVELRRAWHSIIDHGCLNRTNVI